jgi:AcrR family transcriptional regulator
VARKKKLTPRKEPLQARARATVEAILQAAAYILAREGWSRLTTNRIAERAGVNIASFYQYFPNKEAVVIELQRRHTVKPRTAFPAALAKSRSLASVKDVLRFVLGASVDEHRRAPALHRAFEEELPRSVRRSGDHEAEVQEYLRQLFLPHMRNVPDPELALFITRVVAHAVVHEATSHRPELLDGPELLEELLTLLSPYLDRQEAPRGATWRSQ